MVVLLKEVILIFVVVELVFKVRDFVVFELIIELLLIVMFCVECI